MRDAGPNPALQILHYTRDHSQSNLKFQENQIRPLLDLFMIHDLNQATPGSQDDETTGGVSFQVPLDRGPIRAQARQSALRLESDRTSIVDLDVRLSFDLRKLYVDLDNQARILSWRERATELGQSKLDAQISKYKNGISTLVDVVRFQQDLQNSMLDVVSTRVTFNKLLFRRLALEGTLYRSFGISVE